MTRELRRIGLLCLLWLATPWAQAQMIDDVEVRREGADAVVQVRFTTAVQYQRSVSARSSDLVQAFYTVLTRREDSSVITGERRLLSGNGLPGLTITDESVNRSELNRKLVVRLSEAAKVRVRAGRGNRQIELVFEGRGAVLQAPSAAASAPVAAPVTSDLPGSRYVVTLQSSEDPSLQLQTPVPSTSQNLQVLTSSRVVEGRTLYEISIGYFPSRADAQRTLAQLQRRFPKAFVMALAPEATDAAGTAPAGAPDFDAQAAELLAQAEAALQRLDHAAALEPLGKLLELPPNRSTRQAQELIGRSRLQMGDVPRARAEFELFLKLYPTGQDSERVRQQLAALPVEPAPQQAKARADTAPTVTGSLSSTYFGGRSKVRNQEFQDSPLGGLIEVPGSNTLSNNADQKQLITSVDLNWRQRDAERDVRFVLRDSYTNDYMPGKLNKNKLSALYLDYRWLADGVSLRAGRQSPTGGGVFSRFDGVQAGVTLRPRLKLGAVAGVPTDKIADSKRHFYGLSLDAEALTPNLAGSLYLLQQKADQVVERRGLGGDLRYFNGGVSLSGSLDYDLAIHGINLASVQGTWTLPDSTTFNMMWDRRATPLLMLTNRLFYADPAVETALGRTPTRLTDLLGLFSADQLRQDVKGMTPYMTQGMLGVTTPLNPNWQIGSNLSLTNIGAIPPVPGLLDQGQPSTGNLWSGGLQLIGSNLYSARDTHVIGLTYIRGPEYSGYQLSYNNLSALNEFWTLEPSLRYYTQTTGQATANTDSTRWTPGLRVGYRAWQQVTLEAEASLEIGKTNGSNGGTGTSSVETARRLFYYVGGRYDF